MDLRYAIDDLAVCWGCRQTISPVANRAYLFGNEGVLCWDCASRRGGRYDSLHQRWSGAPEVADLLDLHSDQ